MCGCDDKGSSPSFHREFVVAIGEFRAEPRRGRQDSNPLQ